MHDPREEHDPWLPSAKQPPAHPSDAPPPQRPARPYTQHPAAPPRYAPGSGLTGTGIPVGRPPAKPLDHIRASLAWAVIAVCTVVLIVMQSLGMEAMQAQYADDPRPGFNALYLGRYAVGVEQFAPGSGKPLLAAYESASATTPHRLENTLRSAVLVGELDTGSLPDRLAELDALLRGARGDPRDDAVLVLRIYQDDYIPTDKERDGLVERHGWFGEVAASYAQPHSTEAYRAPRRSALHMVVGLISGLVGVLLAVAAGCVLLVVLIVLLCIGKLRLRGPTGPAGSRTAYLEMAALFLAAFIGLQLVLGLVQELTGADMMLAILMLSAVPLLWPLCVGVGWRQYKQDMGYHTGAGLFRELGAGLVGYVAGLPVIAVGFGLTFVLSLLAEGTADHPMQYELMDGGGSKLVLLVGAAVIWAPLVEESVFRSGFYRHLRQLRGFLGFAVATLVTAFVFAAIHPQGWLGVPVLMSIAIVFAALREWRGSIVPAMVAHAVHNGATLTLMGIILFA